MPFLVSNYGDKYEIDKFSYIVTIWFLSYENVIGFLFSNLWLIV